MIRDYSKTRIIWTRHAIHEASEESFDTKEIEKSLSRIAEFPEMEEDKRRGVTRIGERYCTLIYKTMAAGIIVITCWESNPTDINEHKCAIREG
jgi:hypothetical protein